LNSASLIVRRQCVSLSRTNGQPAAAPRRHKASGWFMGPAETIYIEDMVAACNGGGGPLGHPRVYLNPAPPGKVECPYCSRLYVNRATAGAGAAVGPTVSTAMDPPHDRPKSATSG
jgi:uncharacterized Zn-finger protein